MIDNISIVLFLEFHSFPLEFNCLKYGLLDKRYIHSFYKYAEVFCQQINAFFCIILNNVILQLLNNSTPHNYLEKLNS